MKWAAREARAQLAEYDGDYDDDDCWALAEHPATPFESPEPLSSLVRNFLSFEPAEKVEGPKRRKKKSKRPKRAVASKSFWPTRDATLEKVTHLPRPGLYRSKSFQSFLGRSKPDETRKVSDDAADDNHVDYAPCEPDSLSAAGNLAWSCLRSLLPPEVIPSGVAPAMRASMLVKSTKIRMAVLVLWGCNHNDILAVPFVDDEPCEADNGRAVVKETVAAFQHYLNTKLDEANESSSRATCRTEDSYVCMHYKSEYLAKQIGAHVDALERFYASARECSIAANTETSKHGDALWSVTGKALTTFNTKPRNTLAYFDVFQMWNENLLSACSNPDRPALLELGENNQEQKTKPSCCLVCFDEIPPTDRDNPLMSLWGCKHPTCKHCWSRYMVSACGSGACGLKCPAFRCSNSMGVLDAAHVLFGGHRGSGSEDNVATFSKLVKLTMDRFILLDRKGRHCPSPSCKRFLIPTSTSTDRTHCQTVWLCPCGLSLCGDCPVSARDSAVGRSTSHPGMTCATFARVQKEVDRSRFDDMLRTIEWVLKFTRGCPDCATPINRVSGCNHVRCCRCQKYFCWECGGPGERCNAYSCRQPSQYWIDSNPLYQTDSRDHTDLALAVGHCRAYRSTESRIAQIRKGSRGHLYFDLELEFQQALLWLHGAAIEKLLDEEKLSGSFDPLERPSGKLSVCEVTKHGQALSKMESRFRVAILALQDCKSSMPLCGLDAPCFVGVARKSRPRPLNKRKIQSIAAAAAKKNKAVSFMNSADAFAKLSEQHDLRLLRQMRETEFLKTLRSTLKQGIHGLSTSSRAKLC